MKKIVVATRRALALVLVLASPAWAALKVGEKAPDFSATAALAGKPFTFSLAQALAKGPVVLYFFPAAFTSGCSIEAHDFAEATATFAALGATVVGVSTDDIATQLRFSAQTCQGKFAVASDADKRVVKAYDAAMMVVLNYADRVSYVIAPDRTILYTYQSLDPSLHVANTLAAVRAWDSARSKPSSK
jgi:peroxiredoxin